MTEYLVPVLGGAAASWGLSGLATAGAGVLPRHRATLDRVGTLGLAAGIAVLAGLVGWLWVHLGRPPLRTLGETRLWYALLLPLIGLAVELRTGTRMLRFPMLFFGVLFVLINLAKPEALDKTLMPALQSYWFVPHVVVYMAAYAALGLSCGAAAWALVRAWRGRRECTAEDLVMPVLLLKIGLPFLTLGLLFGALWAKEAWGHYWTWDPKETWAFLTWGVYLSILHLLNDRGIAPRRTLTLVAVAFVVVLGCWFLVNYLPAAEASVHTYTRE